MAYSMTGYGRAEADREARSVIVEARSVNHKYIDFNIKMTGRHFQLDDRIRKVIKSRFSRGSFDITVSIVSENDSLKVIVNKSLLKGYMSAAASLAETHGVKYPPTIGELFQVKDLFAVTDSQSSVEKIWPLVEETLTGALDQLKEMRKTEGLFITDDLDRRINYVSALIKKIGQESETAASGRFAILKERIEKLAGNTQLDESRIIQEAALLADRSDISEELTRLFSHLKQASSLIEDDNPIGRKLEFLLQEINREVNTIGSKASSPDITKMVVDVKSELEKIREQAQNLE